MQPDRPWEHDPESPVKPPGKKGGSGCFWWFAIPIVILGLIGGLNSCGGGSDREPDEHDAQVVCKDWVREKLKSPATASFSGETRSGSKSAGYIIKGVVDSQNSFGATVRSSWMCDIKASSDGKMWNGGVTLDSSP